MDSEINMPDLSHAGRPHNEGNPATRPDQVETSGACAGSLDCGKSQISLQIEEAWTLLEKGISTLLSVLTDKNRRTINEEVRNLARKVKTSAEKLKSISKSEVTGPMVTELRTGWPLRDRRGSTGDIQKRVRTTGAVKTPLRLPEKRKDTTPPQGTPVKRRKSGAKDRPVPGRKATTPPEEKAEGSPSEGEWKEQKRRTRRKTAKPRRKVRPSALIVRPEDKAKYADILKRIKMDEPTRVAGECVDKIRRTAAGDMLIIVSKGQEAKRQALQQALTNVLGDDAKVVSKGPQEDLEIRDLDEEATRAEILDALRKAADEENDLDEGVIKSLRKGFRGTQTASITLPMAVSRKILSQGSKIRIGFVNCRLVEVVKPLKCFKCWHYGHLATNCKSKTDRSSQCIKCGKSGHKIADCKETARCALCTEADPTADCAHVAGSSKCPAYQQALQRIRTKQ